MSEQANQNWDHDPTAAERKKDHIALAFQSQVTDLDTRFSYEPVLSGHPEKDALAVHTFLGKQLRAPIWVSSMTGGTALAQHINQNLARACREFGMGMGLGSCRSILYEDTRLSDFDVRDWIGEEQPLYANLGIAQLEQLLEQGKSQLVQELIEKLRADGLMIHINPLQEWLQPEGDRIRHAPLATIQAFIEQSSVPIIVKEVGQGMGYESLKALLQLPIEAVEFAAHGGTNFAQLELLRSQPIQQAIYGEIARIGHNAAQMVEYTNRIATELGDNLQCKQLIISGGVRSFLDGYYLMGKSQLPCIYGQASSFLQHARGDYADLQTYVAAQVRGLELAQAFLTVK